MEQMNDMLDGNGGDGGEVDSDLVNLSKINKMINDIRISIHDTRYEIYNTGQILNDIRSQTRDDRVNQEIIRYDTILDALNRTLDYLQEQLQEQKELRGELSAQLLEGRPFIKKIIYKSILQTMNSIYRLKNRVSITKRSITSLIGNNRTTGGVNLKNKKLISLSIKSRKRAKTRKKKNNLKKRKKMKGLSKKKKTQRKRKHNKYKL